MNQRATGDRARSIYEHLGLLLRRLNWTLPLANTASLFCDTGGLERELVHRGIIAQCTGFDASDTALQTARTHASLERLHGLTYERRNLEANGLPAANFDFIFAHSTMHRVIRLESLLDSIHHSLRPGGLFHLYDFVGPDRFQWTDPQLDEMTAWLQSIPERYRVTLTGAVKKVVGRPSLEDMLAFDASKAAHSSSIEPSIAERFEIVERRALGGTLAMMALADIVHNFDPDSTEDRGHIERLLAREDELIGSGKLGSDFVVVVARRSVSEFGSPPKEAPVAPGASRSEDPVHFSSTAPPTFDAVTADVQMTCAQHLKWIVDRCAITQSEISIGGWALRYPLVRQYSFLINGAPFAAIGWPRASPGLGYLFNYVPYSARGGFSCSQPIAEGQDLYPNGFMRLDLVSDQGMHAHSYRHAWFQPDPDSQIPMPEGWRVKRTIGVADADSYLRGGATIACRLDGYLRERFARPLSGFEKILDWGCGCARVTRHLVKLAKPSAVTGVDIDEDNVNWCAENISSARFLEIEEYPPTDFTQGEFDLVIGISVFTHLSEGTQFKWLAELDRITRKGAIILVSVQGASQSALQWHYEIYQMAQELGFYDYGHNSDLDEFLTNSAYYRAIIHSREYIYKEFGRFFDVLEIVDAIAGNQDLVVMRHK